MGDRVRTSAGRRKAVGSFAVAAAVALGLLTAPAADAAKPGTVRFAATDAITLKVSSESDLRPATTLERTTVSGRIYVFAVVSGKAETVRFFLDDKKRRSTPLTTDHKAPFRLHSTSSSAAGLNTTTLRNGWHRVTTEVTRPNGRVLVTTTPFRVLNTTPAPRNVRTFATVGTVEVRWDSGGGATNGFNVYRAASKPFPALGSLEPLNSDPLSKGAKRFVDTHVVAGKTYYYVVQALSKHGVPSRSPAVSGSPLQPKPNAPTGVAVVAAGAHMSVSWVSGGGSTTGFKVYRSTTGTVPLTGTPISGATPLPKTATTFTDDHVKGATTYSYRVVAMSLGGTAASGVASATSTPDTVSLAAPAATVAGEVGATTPVGGTITNTGSRPVVVENVVLTGAGAGVFAPATASLPLTIPVGDSRPIPVVYSPTAGGSSAVTVGLQTDATVSPTTVVVNASAPTPPVTAGGATGWGALRATPVDWDTTVGNTFRDLLGAAITDQRLVFNRIGTAETSDGDKTTILHTKPWADLKVTNTTSSAISISAISTVGPYSVSGGGGSLAPGATVTLRVTFDYCRRAAGQTLSEACPDQTTKVVQGQLRISNSASGTAVMPLYGLWQIADGGAYEPTAAQFVSQTLGFTSRLVGNPAGGSTDAMGRYMGINYGNGANVAVGDEVLSQFWQATGSQIQIRQVVGSSSGGQQPFGYFPQGSPNSFTQVVRHASTDYQTILPGGTGFSAEATFAAPGGTFGWKVNHNGGSGSGDAADYSQNNRNFMENDLRHGCDPAVSECGHHFRIYKLRNATGGVIANSYLITIDLRGLNLDYNDDVYVITGIAPA